ncbi:hypothetical protein CANCADRAFT_44103 [Tortispora caseinolytica NRRL Y-17796]|uniref:Uncharacterized protein n=1 Tax=Tortispora caseinolytica NRRL Y-17796 TaxID=767744 RepID=A0A1E4TFH0_9ASCO|nr:hypothetical protein CANCADRAFT_44103 [Tortispora caseinolytica NRRL Y-17796]
MTTDNSLAQDTLDDAGVSNSDLDWISPSESETLASQLAPGLSIQTPAKRSPTAPELSRSEPVRSEDKDTFITRSRRSASCSSSSLASATIPEDHALSRTTSATSPPPRSEFDVPLRHVISNTPSAVEYSRERYHQTGRTGASWFRSFVSKLKSDKAPHHAPSKDELAPPSTANAGSSTSSLSSKFSETSNGSDDHNASFTGTAAKNIALVSPEAHPDSIPGTSYASFQGSFNGPSSLPLSSSPSTISSSPNSSGSFMSRFRRSPSIAQKSVPQLVDDGSPKHMVLNKNKNRKQLNIDGLDPSKLRRVTFRVDLCESEPPQQLPSRRSANSNKAAAAKKVTPPPAPAIKLPKCECASEESKINARTKALVIDKPMTRSSSSKDLADAIKPPHAEDGATTSATASDPSVKTTKRAKAPVYRFEPDEDGNMDLGLVYTRCCHLREIMPISSTLKQIAGHHISLSSLKLYNRRPTKIEILALADFVAITPITTLILDNSTFTEEMARILFSSLLHSSKLEKLSMREMVMEGNAWDLLCYLLAINPHIRKLDISYNENLTLSETAVQALADFKGLEELIVSHSRISGDRFKKVFTYLVKSDTKRIGLGYNDISLEDIEVFVDRMERGLLGCDGLDLTGNQLGYDIEPLLDVLRGDPDMRSLVLSNIDFPGTLIGSLVDSLCTMEGLKFLDVSYNPDLRQSAIRELMGKLHLIPSLRRVHLNGLQLGTSELILLAEELRKCKNLLHVELKGIPKIERPAALALIEAVQLSGRIYALNFDNGAVEESLKRILTHYCMLNMEGYIVPSDKSLEVSFEKDDLASGYAIAEVVGVYQKNGEGANNDNSKDSSTEAMTVQKSLINKAKLMQSGIQKRFADLCRRYTNDSSKLNVHEFEQMIRYKFLDIELSNVLKDSGVTSSTSCAPASFPNLTVLPPASQSQEELPTEFVNQDLTEDGMHVSSGAESTSDDLFGEPTAYKLEIPLPKSGTLSSRSSETSLYAKAQEQEEGELHKLIVHMSQLLKDSSVSEQERINHESSGVSGEKLRSLVLAVGTDEVRDMIAKVREQNSDKSASEVLEKLMESIRTRLQWENSNAKDDELQDSS